MSLLSPQLIAFIAVAEHKTVHGAALSMNLTQTAVTMRIRALERMLNSTLFIRSRRGMLLTPEGEALLRYTHGAKELEGEALAVIQDGGVLAEIEMRICAPASIMRSRVIPNCLSIVKQFPSLLFNFDVNDIEERHLLLKRGQMDFAIILEQHLAAQMQFKKLEPEQYILVASAKWKGRKLDDIVRNERIIDFNESDQVTFEYLKQCDLFSKAKHGRYFINQTESLARLVCAGIGYTTLAKEFAQPFVDNKELIILNKGKTYDVSPVLAWFDRPEPPQYFSDIINAIE